MPAFRLRSRYLMHRRTPPVPTTPSATAVSLVPEPLPRTGTLVVASGFAWAIAFLVIGPGFELQTYGDGSIFSYAIALRQAWAVHWHNIPGRLLCYVYALMPAEAVVGLTGSAQAGIGVYGVLHFSAPLLSLFLTRACDATPSRVFFRTSALSTSVLCPFVFGFPTEMWMAHALFWPVLARLHTGRPGTAGLLASYALVQAFVLTHEGAIALLAVVLVTVLVRGEIDRLAVAIGVATPALLIWLFVKWLFPPDDYISGVMGAAAWKFIDLANLTSPFPLLVGAALIAYAAIAGTMLWLGLRLAEARAAAMVAAGLAAYWLFADDALHAENRYPIRTAMLVTLPVLAGAAAALAADIAALPTPLRAIAAKLRAVAGRATTQRLLLGTLALVSLAHAVETIKFVNGWSAYRAEVAGLAGGDAADPMLGDQRFVSAQRIGAALDRLAWNSTTPYLSVLLAPDMRPRRLVVDPRAGYFWLSCDEARRIALPDAAIPRESRDLITALSCLHR